MRASLEWKDGMTFVATARTHTFTLDTASLGGKDLGPSPKEALIAAVLGCSGIDVIAHLKKHRIGLRKFALHGNAESRETHPRIFPQIDVVFDLEVDLPDPESDLPKVIEAVELSMTKYCGVSAMVAPTSPIFYTVRVNGEIEGRGQADFPPEPASKS
ncbi:MAG: OsmC family protein [Bdellovibrionales bacterium]|nr:OsmC family protein [Bdellovibrionales bacterium]